MPTFQNGLTTEVRTVTDPEEIDWYQKNPPWIRVEATGKPEAYPPAERAAKAKAEKAAAKAAEAAEKASKPKA